MLTFASPQLPVLDTDPIIMAGLGTGAAPFRAFIQERAYQKSIGKEVGPALYYFGSRHRSMEYLYGEEIEAYVTEGVLSHTGLAFSRDTDQKVYIQHKMNEDADLLARMLEKGSECSCSRFTLILCTDGRALCSFLLVWTYVACSRCLCCFDKVFRRTR